MKNEIHDWIRPRNRCMMPKWLRMWIGEPDPTVSDAARKMAQRRRNQERNRVIDTANEMRARMGMPPIKRRED